jgi:hypothetical protein
MSGRTSRLGVHIVLASIALAGASCAPLRVESYAPPDIDVAAYRTYAWDQGATLRTGDPRLDNNPFFAERMRAAVDRELTRRGFEPASGAPDLLVHYHASVSQEIDMEGLDLQLGPCDDCEPHVYQAGTLLVDLVDARTTDLAWRGWAEGILDGVIDNQDVLERRVDDTVARILAEVPSPRR